MDYKKALGVLYKPSPKRPSLVDVPQLQFLMIDGMGDPGNSREYAEAMEAIFPVAYAAKFKIKKSPLQLDYGVMPLEGLWWADNMEDFAVGNRNHWKWTLMIMQPEPVSREVVDEVMHEVGRKKNPSALPKLRFELFQEGLSAQILHVGPFSDEGPVIERLHGFIEEQGYVRHGLHHEIYLSDYRKVKPENNKVILRQPCR